MEKIEKESTTVGIISDTHGLVRPSVTEAFKNVDLILHAGDVGTQNALDTLKKIAPVTAVRGNMDGGIFGKNLPQTELVRIGQVSIYILHDLWNLDLDPAAAGCKIVLHGHTHRPSMKEDNEVLYLNPGSAGPVRNEYPVSVALLTVTGEEYNVNMLDLESL
ncbi:metallophosphoesterase family protein [Desulfobacterales bacterium HSG16]|nr:metallophosphoesterase family protein [Desulfobacterales bacterium HSG16]